MSKGSKGQTKTDDYVKLSEITARPYPNTEVSIKFDNGEIRHGTVVRDDSASSGAQNIMVQYNDKCKTTQRFTSADGDKIQIKIGHVKSHYRGGRKYKTYRNKKSKNSRNRKSRRR
jgi:hypothetical protein